MVKVSVLVPIYNVEKYLSQCLESLIHQTLSDIEIICVDDGSTDRSSQILDEYAQRDHRIKAYHKQNTGYGSTMNVALDHATGEYVAILESDDFAEPDMMESLYHKAIKTQVDVVKANLYGYRNGVDSYEDRVAGYPIDEVVRVSDRPEILSFADSIWTCLYQRDFLVKNHIRFHETAGAAFQDISFAEQVWLSAETVCFMDKPVLHYRRDNDASSMYDNRKIFCVFDEYSWIEELFQEGFENKEQLRKLAPFYYAQKYRDFLDHYRRIAAQFQYALLLRISTELERDQRSEFLDEDAFQIDVWRNLESIRKDLYAFFKQSAKYYEDLRIKSTHFQNEEAYAEGFVDTLRTKKRVALYGAGSVGQRLATALMKKECTIDCFLVTEKNDAQNNVLGIPVRELSEVMDEKDSYAVVIAVTERSQMDLYRNLREAGFADVYRVDGIVRKLLD